MKIAGIQLSFSNNMRENIEKALKFIEIANNKKASVICFPELSLSPWFPEVVDNTNFKYALSINSAEITQFQEAAKKFNTVIILPFFEKDETIEGVYYNSAVVIESNGEINGIYRKIHLPLIPKWEEKFYFKPGNKGFPVFDTSIGKIGIQIGWDVFFPEVSRILALKGAEIIFSPTCSAFSSQPRWVKVLTASSLVNTVFITRINRVGKQHELEFYGGSFCAMPDGVLFSEPAGASEGVVLWDIDLKELHEIRRIFPFLKDRMEKEYLEIINCNYNINIEEKNER